MSRSFDSLRIKGALSTGSTLLNLACSEDPNTGFLRGGYYYLVGDSQSGKTWFALSCLAEAARNPMFDRWRLIYDDVEGGALMDKQRYFGNALASRLEPPSVRNGKFRNSASIEEFYYNVWDAIEQKRRFIYVLDSQDALTSSSMDDKFRKQRNAAMRDREVAGSFGDGKAKYHSEHLRQVLSSLRKSGSILLVIGQTRDNIGWGFEKKTYSGGRALRFYANLEIWTAVEEKIRKKVRGRDRTVGVLIRAEVKKNRLTGKIGRDRAVSIPIYYGLGIDDVGSCVDFLVDEKHWRDKKGIIDASELLIKGSREEIIRSIEEDDQEDKVKGLAASLWRQIENDCAPNRKARYA